jgi:hypothetical protein
MDPCRQILLIEINTRLLDYNLRMLGGLFGRPNVEFAAATPASRGKQFRCLFAIQMPGQ